MSTLRILLAVFSLSLLMACGQKGPLYLEGQTPSMPRPIKKKPQDPGAPKSESSDSSEKARLPVLEPAPPN